MTNSPTGPSPTVHTGVDAEEVADALAQVLAIPPSDVFDALLVTCEAPGTQRWLAHRLTRGLGITAGIAMPPFRGWLHEVVARAVGIDPDTDPWRPGSLTWHIAAELAGPDRWPDSALTAWLASHRTGGVVWLARHLAEVLLGYARRRPELLERWSVGDDTGVPAELAWQPPLWRALLARPATAAVPDPLQRVRLAEQVLHSGPAPAVPADVHLWAPGPLTPAELRLLGALSAHHGVHLWLPGRVERQDHPLVATSNREAETTTAALHGAGARLAPIPSADAPARTLLDRLRRDLARGVRGPAEPLARDDTSVSLHSCHGPDRQAEVLRDVLCSLLEDDPTLEPRDVLVACADPGLFPVLEAAFTAVDLPGSTAHPARTLPVRFADPDRRDHNALLGCLVDALLLGRGRATATDLETFLASDPVARHFGLDEDGVERAHDLVEAAGVRWGMNTAHRDRYGLPGVTANTWLSGLNRLLVGIAMTEDGSYAVRSGLPLDDVGSSDIEVVGVVAEVMARLIRLARSASEPHTPQDWADVCREAIEQLMSPDPDDSWQLDHAWRVLAGIAEEAPPDAGPIELDDLLDLLADAVRGRVPRSAFRSGAVTVCSMAPARHVPHRVVCVVGLDDGLVPRPDRVDGDDFVDLRPDPDALGPRHHDRQLFLDLVRSARQHLVLTWTGADPHNGEPRPPAVVVSELTDVLEAMVELPEGHHVRDALVARHPLQPYAPASFGDPATAAFRASALSSFDPAAAAGARALATADPLRLRPPAGPLATRLDVPTWSWDGDVVPLDEVLDVLTHPARAFLKRRAGFTHWRAEQGPADAIPLELDGLGVWGAGDRVLTATLRGDRLEDALRAEQLRGTLPPGAVGQAVLDRVGTEVDRIMRDVAPLFVRGAVTRHVRTSLATGGLALSADITLRGDTLVSVAYGRVGPRHRLAAWLDLLALAACRTLEHPRAHLVGRKDHVVLTAPDPGTARFLLDRWVQVATVGLTTPLPLPLKTGAALASSVRPGTSGSQLWGHPGLRDTWQQERDANWEQLWGDDLADLVRCPRPAALPAIGDESDWIADLARGLWSPIDQAEESR